MSRISKLLTGSRARASQKFVQPKLFIPVDCKVPETSKEIMARTMYQSGLITRDEFEKMLGVAYDVDCSDEDLDFDFGKIEDSWKQSAFASYEEEFESLEVKNVQKEEAQTETPSASKSDGVVPPTGGAEGGKVANAE